MFDVGGPELILIVLAIIVLFGPKKMPEIAQMFAKGMRQVRKAQAQFQSQLNEIQSEINDASDLKFNDTEVVKVRPDNSKARDQIGLDEDLSTKSSEFKVKEPKIDKTDTIDKEITSTKKNLKDENDSEI